MLGKVRWCNEILNVCNGVKVIELDIHEVAANILATKPARLSNDDFIDNLYDEMAAAGNSSARKHIKAVHISDVHLDLKYKVGTKAKCDSLLCCREESGIAEPGEPVAGEWGTN